MISLQDFVPKYSLKNKAPSDIKSQPTLSSLSLSDVGTCLRDGPFSKDVCIVILLPTK